MTATKPRWYLTHSLWSEDNGDGPRWYWSVEWTDDDTDITVDGGIESDKVTAEMAIAVARKEALAAGRPA